MSPGSAGELPLRPHIRFSRPTDAVGRCIPCDLFSFCMGECWVSVGPQCTPTLTHGYRMQVTLNIQYPAVSESPASFSGNQLTACSSQRPFQTRGTRAYESPNTGGPGTGAWWQEVPLAPPCVGEEYRQDWPLLPTNVTLGLSGLKDMSVASIKPFISFPVFLYIFLFSVCPVFHLCPSCRLILSYQFAPLTSPATW